MHSGYALTQRNYQASLETEGFKVFYGDLNKMLVYAKENKGSYHNRAYKISYRNNILIVYHHDHVVLEIDLFDKEKPIIINYNIDLSCHNHFTYGMLDLYAIQKAITIFNLKIDYTYSHYDKKYIIDTKQNIKRFEDKEDKKIKERRKKWVIPIIKRAMSIPRLKKILGKENFTLEKGMKPQYDYNLNKNVNNPYKQYVIRQNDIAPFVIDITDSQISIPEFNFDIHNNFTCKLVRWSKNRYGYNIHNIYVIGKDCYGQVWFYDFSEFMFQFQRAKLSTLLYSLIAFNGRQSWRGNIRYDKAPKLVAYS